ncbi:MAG: CPBP family intramembrane metalloprotease [Clostridia bacterium]|nr:CPBP family intramembrane metalloprotease [Clostridia bacterium]
MLRRLVPLILSYAIFLGSHNILYSVLLSRSLSVPIEAMLAFVTAACLAYGVLVLAEKGFGVVPAEIPPVSLGKRTCFRYLWYGFWGLLGVNCVLSLLFVSGNTGDGRTMVFILRFLSAAVIHPVGEELLFRRLYLPRLGTCLPTSAAIIVQAILFSMTHYASGAGNMLYALAGGFILGTVYRSTGKLYFSILLHSAVNLLGLFLPLVAVPAVCGISLGILLISLLYFLLFRRRKETRL